ncbi:hypothetical protein BT96DRAFT_995982 [Gymnopus androsaceus JB14]|uniref:Uncharacterized protein n=1 Tax=Gymnopus androsaceus JB14 TaxID=1447944 RepID=A0A6A4HHB1_9AGAR|nr:hypothetical protein BT96DRAFT_995982 [Gymnopus androsaceus JB14]
MAASSSNETGPSSREVTVAGKKPSKFWKYQLEPVLEAAPVKNSATTSDGVGGARGRKRGRPANKEVDARGTEENASVEQPPNKKHKKGGRVLWQLDPVLYRPTKPFLATFRRDSNDPSTFNLVLEGVSSTGSFDFETVIETFQTDHGTEIDFTFTPAVPANRH